MSKIIAFIKEYGASIGLILLVLVVAYFSYNLAKYRYLNEFNEYKLAVTTEANKKNEELKKQYESALDQISSLQLRVSTLSSDLSSASSRVQQLSKDLSSRMSKDTSKSNPRLQRCIQLLGRGAELSHRGGELLTKYSVSQTTIEALINGK